MKKSRFSEWQIVAILKEAQAMPIDEVIRKHGISRATFYLWGNRYDGLEVSDLKRTKKLEGELGKLKQMYAELAIENAAIKDVLSRKW